MVEPPESAWNPSVDGPWPRISCRGRLEPDAREWLHANALGSYAMSTLSLMHTRRYHGMLVAALHPPQSRHVILSHAELTVVAAGRTYRLATHQFPNLAPTPGFRLLERFEQAPLPTWIYRLGAGRLTVCLALARRHNTAVVELFWQGAEAAVVTLRPLMPFRSIHSLTAEHGGMMQAATLRSGEVAIKPVPELPPVVFRHSGVFVGSPDWWRQLEYLLDRDRAAAFREDLWTPGTFELALESGVSGWLTVSVGEAPAETAADLQRETRDFLLGCDPGPSRRSSVRTLHVAAASYCATASESPATVAGFPWFDVHWRDSMMALPGLFLVRGQHDQAKSVLSTAFRSMRGGLLPMVADKVGRQRAQPSPDATLWMMEAVTALVHQVGLRDPFVASVCYPMVRRIFARILRGPRRLVWLTDDWLVANSAEGLGLTWMDSAVANRPVVPRQGVPIEWQALWLNALETIRDLARNAGQVGIADQASRALVCGEAAFKSRFWCRETGFPYDCVSEVVSGDHSWGDRSVRPNALLALALRPSLFDPWQATAILDRCRLDLVTPGGVRSLSPTDGRYQGFHEGGLEQREASAHQGTAWPFLLAAFVRASRRRAPDDAPLAEELAGLVESCVANAIVLGHVPQLADGDAPHRARGCPAQAWSVGELLRALVLDLGF